MSMRPVLLKGCLDIPKLNTRISTNERGGDSKMHLAQQACSKILCRPSPQSVTGQCRDSR